jgi:hypothetical protein
MKNKTTKMRGMRLSEATYKAVVQAAKARDYASPSAFMRAAVEKELRGADATLDESEQRVSASLEGYSQHPAAATGVIGNTEITFLQPDFRPIRTPRFRSGANSSTIFVGAAFSE